MSLPAPPMTVSLSLWPAAIVSGPAITRSLPRPPSITSLPTPPFTLSLPSPGVEDVVAVSAENRVVAGVAEYRIVARADVDQVVPCGAVQTRSLPIARRGAWSRRRPVPSATGAGVEDVVPAPPSIESAPPPPTTMSLPAPAVIVSSAPSGPGRCRRPRPAVVGRPGRDLVVARPADRVACRVGGPMRVSSPSPPRRIIPPVSRSLPAPPSRPVPPIRMSLPSSPESTSAGAGQQGVVAVAAVRLSSPSPPSAVSLPSPP